jgi:hypothetical protein
LERDLELSQRDVKQLRQAAEAQALAAGIDPVALIGKVGENKLSCLVFKKSACHSCLWCFTVEWIVRLGLFEVVVVVEFTNFPTHN